MKRSFRTDCCGEVDLERLIAIPMYISLLAHGLDVFLYSAGWLGALVPTLELISAVSAVVFLVMQCLLLPPLGVAIMTAVFAVFSWAIPHFILFVVRSLIESVILLALGGVIAMLSIGVVITVVNGVVVSVVVAPLVTAPFMLGAAAAGATVAAGAAVGAGVNAGVRSALSNTLIGFARPLVNLLLVLLLAWPSLTWTGVLQGVFALKPVKVVQQKQLSFDEEQVSDRYRAFFADDGGYIISGTESRTFDEGFYDSYIYPGRNTFAQGATPAASTDTCLAFCMNGMIYLVDNAANEQYHATAYPTQREDAMVMVGREAFLFADDEIVMMGPEGRYLWEDTQWTTEYERLSEAEQFERLYAILEEQNDGQSAGVPIEDVAVVARAQRSGQLLSYDKENHWAYFAQEGMFGKITVLRQTAPNTREEVTSFTPDCDSENLPYTLLGNDAIAYIDQNSIVFRGVKSEWETVHYTRNSYDGEKNPFVSFHVVHDADGNEYYAYMAENGVICLERLGDVVMEMALDTSPYEAVYSVGTTIYFIKYDSGSLLNKLTYLGDRGEERLTEVWVEAWDWDRIRLHAELWGQEDASESEGSETAKESAAAQYPAPELRTSDRQIGLYKDNVISPSRYYEYKGPVDDFRFRYPSILYEEVDYTCNEDGTEVRVVLYCQDDPSMMIASLKPNENGAAPESLLTALQQQAEADMTNVKVVQSGVLNDGAEAMFYLTGKTADSGLTCTKLCRISGEYIMEMELRIPNAVSEEDRAYKDYYARAMYDCCRFGSDQEPPAWRKFKSKYGL